MLLLPSFRRGLPRLLDLVTMLDHMMTGLSVYDGLVVHNHLPGP